MASDFPKCLEGASCCVAYNLRKAARITGQIYEREMRAAPVKGPQFSLLIMIARRGAVSIGALAREIGADRTTLTRNLQQLEKKRVVQIAAGRDHRSRLVRILPRGTAALVASVKYWKRAQRKVVRALGEDRWTRMLADLSAVAALTPQSARKPARP